MGLTAKTVSHITETLEASFNVKKSSVKMDLQRWHHCSLQIMFYLHNYDITISWQGDQD